MATQSFLAFDLGAESGRAILGTLDNRSLSLKELHRFPTGMTSINGHHFWNVFQFFEEIKKGIRQAGEAAPIESIGLDTWGVDFGLLSSDGQLLGLPYAYRDKRTEGMMEAYFRKMGKEKTYSRTGNQFMPLNTLFQVFSMVKQRSPLLKVAKDLLFIPDLFHYLLTGEKKTEFTFATTSQLFNPQKKAWDDLIFKTLGVSKTIMQKVVPSCTVIGNLTEEVCRNTNQRPIPVVAGATHDTGSAVAAVPSPGKDWVFLSSGTWSLMGVVSSEPIINSFTRDFNYSNEGSIDGGFRILKNIMGLWIFQQYRKSSPALSGLDYAELVGMASQATPFQSFINPDDLGFLNPPNMEKAIVQFCEKTGQQPPSTPPQFIRCIFESLAFKYRTVLEQLKTFYPHPLRKICVIGGGAKNELLCQFTADATVLPVSAGPFEASSIGNILAQAKALGVVSSFDDFPQIVNQSFPIQQYQPRDTGLWNRAYSAYRKIEA